ncbi:MAG: permease, partial [Anaerolineales bacterium]|nr:permease [Anaerolineales bacterium]
ITTTLGGDNPWVIITAALLGIPVYTSNLTAMPLVGGLLRQGMHPAAALAFLIAGPTTTLPAMSAVWGLVNRKVFAFYIGFSLVGAIVLGFIYSLTL